MINDSLKKSSRKLNKQTNKPGHKCKHKNPNLWKPSEAVLRSF